jgi:hypothetical protein
VRRLKETIITAAIICTSDLMRFLFLFFYHYWQPTTAHVVGSFNLYGSPDWNYHEVIVIVCVRFSPSPPLVLSLLQQRWFFRASSIVLQNYSLEIKEKKKPSKTIIHRLGVEISFFEAHTVSCTFEGNY